MIESDNERVTLAVLNTKLDQVIKAVEVFQADHDRTGKLESWAERSWAAIQALEAVALAAETRARAIELQVTRMGVLYGVLGGSVSAAMTMLVSKALGL